MRAVATAGASPQTHKSHYYATYKGGDSDIDDNNRKHITMDEEKGGVCEAVVTPVDEDVTLPTAKNFLRGTVNHRSKRSKNSVRSTHSRNAYLGAVSCNAVVGLVCVNAAVAALSCNAALSILSINSFCSVLSVNSAFSVGCANSSFKICI